MGIISLEKSSQMYWLGRYVERVFTTLQNYIECFDCSIDYPETAYREYCSALGISDVYGSDSVFFEKYLFDVTDSSSVSFSLERAFDNAIVLRNEISTESLSYIHLAQEKIAEAKNSNEPLIVLQELLDYIYAFWGSVDDCAQTQQCRVIIKAGRYHERLDLYIRLGYEYDDVLKSYMKLRGRIDQVGLPYDAEKRTEMDRLIASEEIWSQPGNPQVFMQLLTDLFYGVQFN